MRVMLKAGHAVALLTICLLVIGVLMVNSTELRVGFETIQVTHQSVFFGSPARHAALAIGALALASFLPIKRLAGLTGWMAPRAMASGLGYPSSRLSLAAWCRQGDEQFAPLGGTRWHSVPSQ